MRFVLVVLLSFLIFPSFGEVRELKKVERLFQKGRYERCLDKTNEYIINKGNSRELQHYIVLSNLSLFLKSEPDNRGLFLKNTIQSWEKLTRFDHLQEDYSILRDSIAHHIKDELKNYETRNNAQYIYLENKLAEVFGDTSEFYLSDQLDPLKSRDIVPIEIDNYQALYIQNDANSRAKILQLAKQLEGTQYRYGGTGSNGFDCSGFTQYLYKAIGIELPHNAYRQSKLGDIIDLSEAQPGDLVFFRPNPGKSNRVSHTGIIYSNENGNIELMHCSSKSGVIHPKSEEENTKYWLQRVYCVKQIIPNK